MKLGGLVDVPLKICESDEASLTLCPSRVTLNDWRDDSAPASFVRLMRSTLGPATFAAEIDTASELLFGLLTETLNFGSIWVITAPEPDTCTTAGICLLSFAFS